MYASKKYLNMMEKYQAKKYLEARKQGTIIQTKFYNIESNIKEIINLNYCFY